MNSLALLEFPVVQRLLLFLIFPSACILERQESALLFRFAIKVILAILFFAFTQPSVCQQRPAEARTPAERGIDLALKGQCTGAMPLLDQAMHDTANSIEIKRSVSTAGVRCSMLLNRQSDAMSFLAWLQEAFPHDPDILFLAVHVFSDLSVRNSQELMNTAPDSPLVIQLNAENFEKQGDFNKAIAEYRILLQRVPDKPGIHYRIGALMMQESGTTANGVGARKEFEAELKINPQNAAAEYYLGEIARQAKNLPEAIEYFTRATKLYAGFSEAYFGLGRSLMDFDRPADAVAPLETAVKLSPDNPGVHLALATAYQRLGRKDDASREFALQKSTSEKINQNSKTLKRNVSGALIDNSAQ